MLHREIKSEQETERSAGDYWRRSCWLLFRDDNKNGKTGLGHGVDVASNSQRLVIHPALFLTSAFWIHFCFYIFFPKKVEMIRSEWTGAAVGKTQTAHVVWARGGGVLSLFTGAGLSHLCCHFGDLRWNRMVLRLLLWCAVLRLKENALQNSLQLVEASIFKKKPFDF